MFVRRFVPIHLGDVEIFQVKINFNYHYEMQDYEFSCGPLQATHIDNVFTHIKTELYTLALNYIQNTRNIQSYCIYSQVFTICAK